LVVTQLPSAHPSTKRENFFIYLVNFVIVGITAAATFYFRTYIAGLFTSIELLPVYLTLISIVILIAVLGMEMYKTYQKKMRALDF